MNKQKIYKLATITAIIGLGIIFSVILSGVAYPNIFFSIGTLLGFIFIFLSILLLFISWVWELHDAVKSKQYRWAISLIVIGLITIIRIFIKNFWTT